MTVPVVIVLSILGLAIILFITERVRVDVIGLMVLVSLAVAGIVTPSEALSGFSSPAVVTVWAVLILSSGLARTGVASLIGGPVLRLAGRSEARLIAVIMLVTGALSGFMNAIGVAALMLPVVVDVAHRTKRPPSRLLMPLAFAALLGGLNTLIGTPPNLLISEALRSAGLEPFHMFDFTPTGVAVMLGGTAFMVLVGRHLLPKRDIMDLPADERLAPGEVYGLRERLFAVRLPQGSSLEGRTLAQCRLGAAIGLNVVAILRRDRHVLAPGPNAVLRSGDRLMVEGRSDPLAELQGQQLLVMADEGFSAESLHSEEVELAELRLSSESSLVGLTLEQAGFRQRYKATVLAMRRAGVVVRTNLERLPLGADDVLLVQGTPEHLDALQEEAELERGSARLAEDYRLEERLVRMRVPADSALVGKTLQESRLRDGYGLEVTGFIREGATGLMPDPQERFAAEDLLLLKARPDDLLTLQGLQGLETDTEGLPQLSELQSDQVGLVEVVLSPRTTLAGKTLRQMHFRDKYGLSVLAIWREGRAYRSNLRDMPLRFGDALLLHGPRQRMQVLGLDSDFTVLTEAAQQPPRSKKALTALLIMAAVLVPVIVGWLPIAITAIAGVVLMILTGCLTMEEAYGAVEWRAVFLIAGMLPLGLAMEQTGTAQLLAQGIAGVTGPFGPLAVLAGLFLLAALSSQVMPNPAVAVMMAPIALNTAADLGVSPYPFMMAVAVSASAAFLSPIGHSANMLVMGPGGYRFSDYPKVGLPLTLVVLAIVLAVVPLIWPF